MLEQPKALVCELHVTYVCSLRHGENPEFDVLARVGHGCLKNFGCFGGYIM